MNSLKFNLKEDLKFCKSSFALLYNTIEDEFNIELSTDDEQRISNIEDIVTTVRLKTSDYKKTKNVKLL